MKKGSILFFFFLLVSTLTHAQVALHIFAGQGHKVYLGCINCSQTDPSSIYNEYGQYGSKYNANSIWNQYGSYGSKYGQYSPFNAYSQTPPVIVDFDGNFYGYLTANKYFPKRSTLAVAERILAIGGGENYIMDNSGSSYNYVPQQMPRTELYTPNWEAMHSMMEAASRRVEELYRQGYVYDPVSNGFVTKEAYADKVQSGNDQREQLKQQFNTSRVRTRSLSDGDYGVGLFSHFEADPVYYGVAKVKNGRIRNITITTSNGSAKLYPQSKGEVFYGFYEGMLVYSSILKAFAPSGTNAKVYFLNKVGD